MHAGSVVLVASMLLIAGPAAAEAPAFDAERYVVEAVEDGVLRIDRQTGATDHCRATDDGWACRVVPDERAALDEEIDRLSEENAALAERVEDLESRLAEADVPPAEDGLDLPSEAELDQLMDTFESMMHRFMGMVRSLSENFEREDGGAGNGGDGNAGGD